MGDNERPSVGAQPSAQAAAGAQPQRAGDQPGHPARAPQGPLLDSGRQAEVRIAALTNRFDAGQLDDRLTFADELLTQLDARSLVAALLQDVETGAGHLAAGSDESRSYRPGAAGHPKEDCR